MIRPRSGSNASGRFSRPLLPCSNRLHTAINTFFAGTIISAGPRSSMDSGNPFQLIDILRCHDVPLVIIGGHAVTFHEFSNQSLRRIILDRSAD